MQGPQDKNRPPWMAVLRICWLKTVLAQTTPVENGVSTPRVPPLIIFHVASP